MKEKNSEVNEIRMPCIVCPLSCHLVVSVDEEGNVQKVTGNSCSRGEKYARDEMTNPMRMVTSTVVISEGIYKRLPVILSGPIPKDQILSVMEQINRVKVCAPIQINDIIIENILGLEVNLIASRSMPKKTV